MYYQINSMKPNTDKREWHFSFTKWSSPVYCRHWLSPLGPMVLAQSEGQLLGCWFEGQRHAPDPTPWPLRDNDPLLERAVLALQRYFAQPQAACAWELPLHPGVGTVFQRQVWRALQAVPAGSTTHYGALAEQLGRPGAARAVGAAVGKNPWIVLVPCHRVLGQGGSLTGYAAGLERKSTLLQWERSHA